MSFLIDGHNLIPRVPGLGLDQLDDEMRLVDRLEAFFRGRRTKAIVFFDRGQPGQAPQVRRGFVTARFSRPPVIADQAIRAHLRALGRAAANYTVVSSDHEVIAFAQKMGARTLSSSQFASMLCAAGKKRNASKTIPPDDTDYWLRVFGDHS